MFRPEAVAVARAFVDLVDDCCEQLTVAGSLRRRLARIGDVEIVAVPKLERVSGGLFADDISEVDLLHARLEGLLDNGVVQQRLDVHDRPRWGPTLKFLTYSSTRVDLFCPSAERYGWILLLRTARPRSVVNSWWRRTDGRRTADQDSGPPTSSHRTASLRTERAASASRRRTSGRSSTCSGSRTPSRGKGPSDVSGAGA